MLYFIVNKHGGSGRAQKTWDKLEALLKEKNVEYTELETQHSAHATQLVQEICKSRVKDKTVIVVGGDGTVNNVLNGIKDFSKIKFAIIPTGSGNDFVRGLGIPTKDKNIEKNLDSILEGKVKRQIDIGKISSGDGKTMHFGISCGLGLDAIVCEKTNLSKLKNVFNKLHIGNLIYLALTVYTLFSMKSHTVTIKFDDEEEKTFDKVIFFAGLNTFAEGGGVKMAPYAKVDDGKLDFCMAYGIPKILTFSKLPFLSAGKHVNLKGFMVRQFEKMKIVSETPMTAHADGEHAGYQTEVTVECLASKLNLLQ